MQALTIPLLLLVAALSSANTGGFFAYPQQRTSLHEEIIKSSLFAETMKIVGLRQAQNAGIEYDYHEEDQPTQSSEPVQVLCIYHLLYEVKHLLKFRF